MGVSQGTALRRLQVNGSLELTDSYDRSWSGSVWNMVFAGVEALRFLTIRAIPSPYFRTSKRRQACSAASYPAWGSILSLGNRAWLRLNNGFAETLHLFKLRTELQEQEVHAGTLELANAVLYLCWSSGET
jgi:hypothetical protein